MAFPSSSRWPDLSAASVLVELGCPPVAEEGADRAQHRRSEDQEEEPVADLLGVERVGRELAHQHGGAEIDDGADAAADETDQQRPAHRRRPQAADVETQRDRNDACDDGTDHFHDTQRSSVPTMTGASYLG